MIINCVTNNFVSIYLFHKQTMFLSLYGTRTTHTFQYCRIYMLESWVSIAWGNGLLPATLLSIGPLGTNLSQIQIKNKKLFIHENAFENIVCEMAAFLSRGDYIINISRVD